jgi:hypothetical protein
MWLLAVLGFVGFAGAGAWALCAAAGRADDAFEMAIEEERRRQALAEVNR